MIEAAESISSMMSRQNLDDPILISAIQFQLVVIGEACSTMLESTRQLMPEIPFNQIRSVRNRLVHRYFSLDTPIIRSIAADDVPLIKAACERTLAQLYPETLERLVARRLAGNKGSDDKP